VLDFSTISAFIAPSPVRFENYSGKANAIPAFADCVTSSL